MEIPNVYVLEVQAHLGSREDRVRRQTDKSLPGSNLVTERIDAEFSTTGIVGKCDQCSQMQPWYERRVAQSVQITPLSSVQGSDIVK